MKKKRQTCAKKSDKLVENINKKWKKSHKKWQTYDKKWKKSQKVTKSDK